MSISKADVDGAETSKVGIDAAEACRVGVRVPPFYPEKPALWFAQMDAQFALANIKTDETKYFYVTGHLDPKYADVVEDIIANPPASDKYEKLKAELIKRQSASREEKVKQLLMHEELGDRKPSQFYRTNLLKEELGYRCKPRVKERDERTLEAF